MHRTWIVVMTCILFSYQSFATEVDNITHRHTSLRDSRSGVNRLVNNYIADAVALANRKQTCDPWTFMRPLAKRIGTGFISNVEKDIMDNTSFDIAYTKRKESIYRDFSIFEGLANFFTGLGPLIRVNDYVIGIDKLGHFLGTGFLYFERMYHDGKTYADILRFGEKTERSYFGLALTGVYSYADLAANIDGFDFWERMMGFGDKANMQPYVGCENNRWVVHAMFDIADYINPAWDEAENCSRFRTKKMSYKVARRISALEVAAHQSYGCPVSISRCASMIERYGDAARSVITPKCLALVSNAR